MDSKLIYFLNKNKIQRISLLGFEIEVWPFLSVSFKSISKHHNPTRYSFSPGEAYKEDQKWDWILESWHQEERRGGETVLCCCQEDHEEGVEPRQEFKTTKRQDCPAEEETSNEAGESRRGSLRRGVQPSPGEIQQAQEEHREPKRALGGGGEDEERPKWEHYVDPNHDHQQCPP